METQNTNQSQLPSNGVPRPVAQVQTQVSTPAFNLTQHPQASGNEDGGMRFKKRLILFLLTILCVGGFVFGYVYYDVDLGGSLQGRFFNVKGMDVYTSEPDSRSAFTAEAESEIETEDIAPVVRIDASSSGVCMSESDYLNPKTPVLRKHFAKMLVDGAGLTVSSKSLDIRDFTQQDPCYPYVSTLIENGVFRVYFDKTVHPDEPMTRSDVAIWVVKAFELPFVLVENGASFPDVPVNAPYNPYVEVLNKWGAIFMSMGETAFNPKDDAQYDWAETVLKVIKLIKSNSRII